VREAADAHPRLRQVFLASAKGRVLERLRRAPQTVEELAGALGVTANAVRSQLVALQREGLVRRAGVRRGTRRPSYTYGVAPGAERLFCHAYVPFLEQLLRALTGRMTRGELDEVIRTVGRSLATPRVGGPLPARVNAAAKLLDALGAVTDVKAPRNGRAPFLIYGLSCPLDAVARSHSAICAAVESFVAEVTRARARQRCRQRDGQPQCVIEVTAVSSRPGRSRRSPGRSLR
jgi:predicted ArsR family transcriptional regulator